MLVTRRRRYACTACRGAVVQAPAPPRLTEAGLPSERRLVHVAVADYDRRIDVSTAMIHVAMGGVLLRRNTHD